MSTSDTPSAGDRPDDPARATGFVAYVVTSDDGPDECTIAPADASGVELLSRWITAEEGSFVPLPEMR